MLIGPPVLISGLEGFLSALDFQRQASGDFSTVPSGSPPLTASDTVFFAISKEARLK
jgi:hypothetical protein